MKGLRSCGEMLREERLRQGRSVAEMVKLTRIRAEVLEGIEKGLFSRVASFAMVRGLIASYAKALGLEVERVLAVFRRDFVVGPKGDVLLKGLAYPLNEPGVRWTPRLTMTVVIGVVVAGFGGYLGYQYWRANSVPPLEVETPGVGAVLGGGGVEVVGKTWPDAQVRVNSRLVVVDEKGKFRAELVLPEGKNEIEVEVVSRIGRVKVVRREVTVGKKGEGV